MKIKCITDTITNSSREIFVIRTDITEHKLQKIFLEITKYCIGCSGERGVMSIHTNQSLKEDGLNLEWLREGCFGLHIDYGYDRKYWM